LRFLSANQYYYCPILIKRRNSGRFTHFTSLVTEHHGSHDYGDVVIVGSAIV
jgi:hypothetical protein